MENHKNELSEFVQNIGYLANCITYNLIDSNEYGFRIQVLVSLNNDVAIIKEGSAKNKLDAQMMAANAALDELKINYSPLMVDWNETAIEAQAGDALIKLAAYMANDLDSSEAKSRWLQHMESDANLAKIFDRLQEEGRSSVTFFGENLGKKHKATWVEALIWNWFNDKGIPPTLKENLESIYQFLGE